MAIILQNGRCFLTTGTLKYKIRPQEQEDYSNSLVVRGTPACFGLSKGVVRVILNKKDLDKFKKGEIIVTGNATKVLKTGDMVEVDANKGTLKILKKIIIMTNPSQTLI